MREHVFTPPYTPCWQWAEVIENTGKVFLRDIVGGLQKNYTKTTLQRTDFLPSSEIMQWEGCQSFWRML